MNNDLRMVVPFSLFFVFVRQKVEKCCIIQVSIIIVFTIKIENSSHKVMIVFINA